MNSTLPLWDTKVRNAFAATTPASRWYMQRFFALPRLAHHPTCQCFNHHLVRLGSHSFCLGCVCLWSGAMACLLSLGIAIWMIPQSLTTINPWAAVSTGVLLTLPTYIQPFFQKKWFKVFSRTNLGIGLTIFWLGFLGLFPLNEQGWVLRGVFILIFIALFKLSLGFRLRFTPKTNCLCGPKAFPYCPENQKRNEGLLRQFKKMAKEEDLAMMPVLEAVCQVGQMGKQLLVDHGRSTVIVESFPSNRE